MTEVEELRERVKRLERAIESISRTATDMLDKTRQLGPTGGRAGKCKDQKPTTAT